MSIYSITAALYLVTVVVMVRWRGDVVWCCVVVVA